ncbi:TadE/TadG family type IV pilus assembly protein [Tsuneonella mangrovi]|uniref:TadE/TadG family type IV pilus assembly protein n=1 Tax=Tsuneonella mangrovi TaxID=1982042 RepID=UPI000BA25A15|nr:TadE/TadG family type IV pilus assembly protein [Tsuneonella mangrovi]
MMLPARLPGRTNGSAAVEFALTLPLMLILLFGGMEAGHFVWTQHKLAEAVRDGSRYAARLPLDQLCQGNTQVMSTATADEIKLMTRTGQIANANAPAKVPFWSNAQVQIYLHCGQYSNTGLYEDYSSYYNGEKGPVIEIAASNVQYPWMFDALGAMMSGIFGTNGTLSLKMNAVSISPGIGL